MARIKKLEEEKRMLKKHMSPQEIGSPTRSAVRLIEPPWASQLSGFTLLSGQLRPRDTDLEKALVLKKFKCR